METLLKALLAAEKKPCLTIILSTEERSFDDREKLQLELKKEIAQVGQYGGAIGAELMEPALGLLGQVDLNRLQKGIGIFVSRDIARLVYFPFPVKSRTVINDAFDLRDVLYTLGKQTSYAVLLLSKGNTRLFEAEGTWLREVVNDHFPKKYEEEFQFEHIHPARPGQQFYTDEESKIDQSRLEDFFRSIDHALNGFLQQRPLVVFAVDKHLSTFKKVSRHADEIAGQVTGNYDHTSIAEIGKMAWLAMEVYNEQKQQEVDAWIDEARNKKRFVSGVQEVWDAVREARGYRLFLERDYTCPAYANRQTRELVLEGDDEHYEEVPDAVESIIDMALNKGTEIYTVDNGQLAVYDHIALITRY